MTRQAVLLALLSCLVAAPVRADEYDDALKGLEKAVRDKSKVDVEHFSKILGEKFKEAKPEQQKNFFIMVKKAFVLPEKEAKEALMEALAKSADARAFEILSAEYDKAKDDVELQMKAVRAIGRLGDAKAGAAFLKKLLNNKSVDIIAAAVDAFGGYKDADLATKKEVVGDLLKNYGSTTSAGEKPKAQTSDKQKLEKTRQYYEASLKQLTGVADKTGFEQWWKWWNDAGKKAEKW
jgi:hypothetical protein